MGTLLAWVERPIAAGASSNSRSASHALCSSSAVRKSGISDSHSRRSASGSTSVSSSPRPDHRGGKRTALLAKEHTIEIRPCYPPDDIRRQQIAGQCVHDGGARLPNRRVRPRGRARRRIRDQATEPRPVAACLRETLHRPKRKDHVTAGGDVPDGGAPQDGLLESSPHQAIESGPGRGAQPPHAPRAVPRRRALPGPGSPRGTPPAASLTRSRRWGLRLRPSRS